MSFDLRAIFVNVFAAARDGRPLTLYALLTCVNEADRKIILNHRIVYKFEIVTPYLIAIRRGHIATALVIRNFFAAEMSQDDVSNMADEQELPYYKFYCLARDGKTVQLYAELAALSADDQQAVLVHFTNEDSQSASPFLIAARNGHSKTVNMLLKYFKVDIEQTGMFKYDGHIIDSATALWCAGGDGNLAVVRVLVQHKADVNHATMTNSTPLRAACYDGHIDVVSFLLEHGADLNIANRFKNTCLMIACFRGHLDVVRCLLKHGADPDVVAHSGETAMHFAVERGFIYVIEELLRFNASLIPNESSLTPLMSAANDCQKCIVEFFVARPDCCTREQAIDALELLGASFANDKETYNVSLCYEYLRKGMALRYEPGKSILRKCVLQPVAAYGNRKECQTLEELESIRHDHFALHMEALIVRERILTSDHEDIPHPIIYRGAVFADTEEYERCVLLWMRAMELRQKNLRPIHKDLLRFAQLFSQMVRIWIGFPFQQALTVLQCCYEELIACKEERHKVIGKCCECRCALTTPENYKTNYDMNVHTALYLLHLLCNAQGTDQEKDEMHRFVYKLNQLIRDPSKCCVSLLHMACDHTTHVDDFYVNEVIKFPCAKVVATLLKCGADANAQDGDGNTPLHVIVRYDQPMSDFNNLHNTITELIDHGAHVDKVNNQRQTPIDVSTTSVADVIILSRRKLSLQCLAARAIKTFSISYADQLTNHLKEFVDIH